MGSSQELASAIRLRGSKLTRPRTVILRVLESSRGHLDAGTVCIRAKEKDPRIGITTVYRTLALLKNLGLAEEHDLGEDHGHFEAADKARPYFHFTCVQCGKVVELESPQIMWLTQNLCEQEGLSVSEVHLRLSGHCRQCRPAGSKRHGKSRG